MLKIYVYFFCLFFGLATFVQAQGPQDKPFKPEKAMINLNEFENKSITLEIGQVAYFQYTIADEVKNQTGASLYADDPGVLSMEHSKSHWYISPPSQKFRKHIHTTVFSAVAAGTTVIHYEEEHLPTGDKKTIDIEVVVK